MLKTMRGGAAILAVALASPTAELSAQQDVPAPRIRAEAMGRIERAGGTAGIEGILRMRDRLELTEDQVRQLDQMRSQRVEQRASESAEMEELRSRLRAGTIERAEAVGRIRVLREARTARAAEQRAQVESVLSEDQRAALEQLGAQRRAFEAGRRSAIRGQMRGFRGEAPGVRGQRPGAPGRGPAMRGAPNRAPRPGFVRPRGRLGPGEGVLRAPERARRSFLGS